MQAKSIKGKSTEEIKTALQQSMADGYQPTLAIVFLSVKQDHKAICKLMDDAGIAVFGCTTNGEFIDEVTEKVRLQFFYSTSIKIIFKFILKNTLKRITGK